MAIALCMIVKDFEKNVVRAIESVLPIVNEIVIVTDNPCKDKNILNLEKKYKARLVPFKWVKDYSVARNRSLEGVKSDWILILDADETIDQKHLSEIKALTEQSDVSGFSLTQENMTENSNILGWRADGDSGFFTTKIVRLFKNNPKHRFRYKIHELVEPSILENKGKIKFVNIPIRNYGYVLGEDVNQDKLKTAYELSSEQIKLTPSDPKPYYDAGEALKAMKKYNESLAMFKKVIDLDPKFRDVWTCLGENYFYLNNQKEAAIAYRQALLNNDKDTNALTNLGVLYASMSENNKAEMCFKKAISVNQKNVVAFRNLFLIYKNQKRYLGALDALRLGVKLTKAKNLKDLLSSFEEKFKANVKANLKINPKDEKSLKALEKLNANN